jgi:hypothetical protein
MTTKTRQRLGSILGVAIMVATAIASGGGARAADNGAAPSQSQRSGKAGDTAKPAPPPAAKPAPGPHYEARRGRGHF